MHPAAPLRVAQGCQQLRGQPRGMGLGQRALARQQGGKWLADHEFHGDPGEIPPIARIMHGDDIGVDETGGSAGFIGRPGGIGATAAHQFQSDQAAQAQIHRLQHRAAGALADHVAHGVAAGDERFLCGSVVHETGPDPDDGTQPMGRR